MLDTDQLDATAAAFIVLGRFHQQTPDDESLAGFRELLAEWPLTGTSAATEGLRLMRESAATGEDADAIRQDHMWLYGTLAHAKVAPYESVHRGEDRLIFDDHTLKVRDAYRSLSLQAPRLNREPDDHIGLELDFVAQSCLRALDALEQGAPGDAERYVRFGADFLRDHLLTWAPQMLGRVVAEADTLFMKGLAQLSIGAIESYAKLTGVPNNT